MEQISEHVWAETGFEGANVGCVVGARGLAWVESPMSPPDARAWRDAVLARVLARVSVEPIFVVNTDHHFDHAICGGMLGGHVVMHQLAADGLRVLRGNFREVFERFSPEVFAAVKGELDRLALPEPAITFSESVAISLGDVHLEAVHVGGHSAGTVFVHVPEDRVLFTGDNVTHGRHAYMGEGDYGAWMQALDRMLTMDVGKVVPGHGDVCDVEAIRTMRGFFERMKSIVSELRDQGKTRDEIARSGDALVRFFPLMPGREEMVAAWVADALARMHDEL